MSSAGFLGRDLGVRFTVVGLVPTIAAGSVVAAVMLAGAPGQRPQWSIFVTKLGDLSAAEGGALVLAVVVIAFILQPLQVGLVRLLEGYWPESAPFGWLAGAGRAVQGRRRRRLAARATVRGTSAPSAGDLERMARAATQFYELPSGDRMMPTRLGCVLRAAEDRAGGRYGLDTVAAWPRLEPLVSSALAETLRDARLSLDAAARMCVAWGLATVVLVTMLAPYGLWLLLPLATFALAFLSYGGAVSSASAYGRGLEAAFDLHRFDLLKALAVSRPCSPTTERATNAQITTFLATGGQWPLPYDSASGEVNRPEPSETGSS
jgi:hypothetical protein